MFRVLQAHEECEPEAVLRTQSKRAQKRLNRQEIRKNKADRERDAHGVHCDAQRYGAEQHPQSAMAMYEELLSHGSADPDDLDQIISQAQRTQWEDLAATTAYEGGRYGAAGATSRPGPTSSAVSIRGAQLPQHTLVDSPPGPGPGSGTVSGLGPGPGLGTWAGASLSRQTSVPPMVWPMTASAPAGHSSAGGLLQGQLRGKAGPKVLFRLGAFAGGGGGGGSPTGDALPTENGTAARTPAGKTPNHSQLCQQPPPGDAEEDFPVLQPAASVGSPKAAQQSPLAVQDCSGGCGGKAAGRRTACRDGQHHQEHHLAKGSPGRGFPVAKHVPRNGIKVLHAATHGSHGTFASQVASSAVGKARRSGRNSSADGAASSTNLDLSLLWDLLQGGLCLRADPLAESNGQGGLEPKPDEAEAIKRLVRAQCREAEGPTRGVSTEEMIEMMGRAHQRQCKKKNGASGRAAAATRGGRSREGDGSCSSSDDEPYLYLDRAALKTWRHTVEWMIRNDWVLVKDTDGKHPKYRRYLPNGLIQRQTVSCTPSDAMRGIRNLQAELARKDEKANEVITAWRRQERERRKGVAAGALAADQQER